MKKGKLMKKFLFLVAALALVAPSNSFAVHDEDSSEEGSQKEEYKELNSKEEYKELNSKEEEKEIPKEEEKPTFRAR